MLRGGNMWFQPAIFIWLVFAQSFFKFHKNGDIRKLKAWSFRLWKNNFCRLYNKCARALQISITIFLIHPVYVYNVILAFIRGALEHLQRKKSDSIANNFKEMKTNKNCDQKSQDEETMEHCSGNEGIYSDETGMWNGVDTFSSFWLIFLVAAINFHAWYSFRKVFIKSRVGK